LKDNQILTAKSITVIWPD